MPAVVPWLAAIGVKAAAVFGVTVGWGASVAIGSTPLALTVDTPRVRLVRVAHRLRHRFRHGLAKRVPFPRPTPIGPPRDARTKSWGLIRSPIRYPRSIRTPWEVFRARLNGLIGPLRSPETENTCMVPIFPPGTTYWFDPRITPEHLDFVLVAPSEATLQWLLELADEAAPEFAQAHPTLHDVWIKQLRIYRGRAYLVTNEGQLELGDNEVLGVLVHAERQ